MAGIALNVPADAANFDEAAYLRANPDVAAAVRSGHLASGRQHFDIYGHKEGRRLRLDTGIAAWRRAKLAKVRRHLRKDMACVRRGLKYDFLSDALRAETGIVATDAVSGHPYDSATEALIAEFPDGIVLDCGAGRRPVYYDNVTNFEIVDYDTTDIIGVGECLPFVDGSIDAVISIAVLEHIRDPFACAREIVRVLRPGGKLLCVVPFLQPEHGYPHHYFNMAPQGLRSLFERSLHIDDHRVTDSILPVFTLTWFLHSWQAGLQGAAREQFRSLRIGDLADAAAWQFLDQPWVRELPMAKNFELASATMLLAHKPG